MSPDVGDSAQIPSFFYAISFLKLDGFDVPAPAQVTQTVGRQESDKIIMDEVLFKSPNTLIVGHLKKEGEIRFGPSFYSLFIQDLGSLKGRYFGQPYLWSEDSRYLALQEWITIREADGPWTRLLLVDFQTKLSSQAAGAKGGFIKPMNFEGTKIVYSRKIVKTEGEFEVDISAIRNWERLDWV